MLRIGVQPTDPGSFSCAWKSQLKSTPTCRMPGYIAEGMGVILRQANIDFKLVDYRHVSFGEILESIYNGTIDTFVYPLSPTAERLERANASVSIWAWGDMLHALGTAKHRQDPMSIAFNYVQVYDFWTWLLLACVIVISSIYMFVCGPTIQRLFNVNVNEEYRSVKFHIVLVSFFILVFESLYGNAILSSLLTSKSVYQFDNFDQLMERLHNQETKLLVVKRSSWNRHPESDVQRMMESFAHNEPIWLATLNDWKQHEQKLTSGDAVLMLYEWGVRAWHSKICNTRIVPLPTLGRGHNGFLFNPNVSKSLIERINDVINQNQVMMQQIKDRYAESMKRRHRSCAVTDKPTSGHQKVQMIGILGIVLLLIFGSTIGLITMLFERCLKP